MNPCLAVSEIVFLSILPLGAQAPVHVDYTCPAEDVDAFGLTCSEDQPCAVYFEVSAVNSMGSRVFVAGDIHTATITLYGVLLSTDDGGASWEESIPRIKSAAFDQFQAISNRSWLSGHHIEPLPKDPFFLVTIDGGKTWRQRALFEETRFGSIAQFHFDAVTTGELIFDDSVGKTTHQELYATMSGGENWDLRQTSTKPLHLKATESQWIVTAATGSKTYLIERIVNGKKEAFARFLIHIGDCK